MIGCVGLNRSARRSFVVTVALLGIEKEDADARYTNDVPGLGSGVHRPPGRRDTACSRRNRVNQSVRFVYDRHGKRIVGYPTRAMFPISGEVLPPIIDFYALAFLSQLLHPLGRKPWIVPVRRDDDTSGGIGSRAREHLHPVLLTQDLLTRVFH